MQGTKLPLSPQLHLQGMHRETEGQEPGRGKTLQGQDACPQTGVSLCPGTQANIGQVGPRHTARRPEQGSWLCPASVLPRDQDPDLCAGQWAERVLSQERRPWAGSEEVLRGQGSFQKRHCGQALGRKPRVAQVGRKEAQSQAGVALRRGGWRQEAGGGAEKQEGRSRQGCMSRAPAHKPTACCCHCPVCPVAFAAAKSLLRWGQSQEGWRRLRPRASRPPEHGQERGLCAHSSGVHVALARPQPPSFPYVSALGLQPSWAASFSHPSWAAP